MPPLTPGFRPAAGAVGGGVLHSPSPDVVANDPVAVILDGPVSRERGRDRRGLEDPPVRGSLADWVAAPSKGPRKTALTAILGVWGTVWRNPRPQDRL
ncbi:MAG: hypothetical protein OXE45_14255 [bacterium]|nr:hypothetical protein [bacterium]